ncbi:hypothetical protein COE76_28485 [Bacillus pseudomycoides]|nr:hypothetical protein COE76_28485 [Bacillus pseudomycoides]
MLLIIVGAACFC